MNTDIRIQMSFYNNTKVKRLKLALGADAVLSLIFLWLYTAENRPHGELRGMDEHDVAIAAQWSGDVKEFVKTLRELKFLDKRGKLFLVHDWESNNPWAASAEDRKKRAQDAAKSKWAKRNGKQVCPEHTSSNAKLCGEHTSSNAPSPSPYHLLSLPSPSPSPSPKDVGGPSAAATRSEIIFAQTFELRKDDIIRLFPELDYEVEREICITHYAKEPPPVDPYEKIVKWFARSRGGAGRFPQQKSAAAEVFGGGA